MDGLFKYLHHDDLLSPKAVPGCGPESVDPAAQEIAAHPNTQTLAVNNGVPA